MNYDDLLSLLDLKGTESQPSAGGSILQAAEESASPPAASPTALDVDEWGLRRGRDLLVESERLQKLDLCEHAAADFFAAGFDPDPHLLPDCTDARRHQFLGQLLNTPEYHELHEATQLDSVAAEIAAAHFAEQFAALQHEKKDDKKQEADSKHSESGMGDEMATLRAVGKALVGAREEVEELKEAQAAMGMGLGAPGSNDPRAVAALFKRVRSDPALKRICELAGRFRRVAQSKQRRKVVHGLDDVVDVEPCGDLARLLPHELVRLTDPDLELDTLRRLIERQTLCRQYHATEPVAKGPIIVTVDESGSMSGEKVHTAKALTLALAWIARQQRRWCALVAYSGDSGERLLALPPGRWDEVELADWLTAFIGRGSDLDVPLRELPRMYEELKAPVGDTDVLMVTDALCKVPASVAKAFTAWKAATKARVVALVIDSDPGELAGVCDELHVVPALSADTDAVGRVLSI